MHHDQARVVSRINESVALVSEDDESRTIKGTEVREVGSRRRVFPSPLIFRVRAHYSSWLADAVS